MIQTDNDIKKFKLFLKEHKKHLKGKGREIARETGIHFNTVYNYIDGFHPNPETCKTIMDFAIRYLPEEEENN